MDYLFFAEQSYYSEDNSNTILEKAKELTSCNITDIKHELLCIFNDIINNEPSCYWDKDVFITTEKNLQNLIQQGVPIIINDEIFELFLSGYNAYMQVTNVINDLSGVNDSHTMKNRQYRLPTYVSIVEGCLTNLYHFITLLLDQVSDKDYKSTYQLKSLCEILNKNDYNALTKSVDINIRNAINHGGVIFHMDGAEINFHYNEQRRSVSRIVKAYDFDKLINDVYDTASAIVLGITVFLNNNWNLISIDKSEKSFVSLNLLAMELSIPAIRCRYISEAQYFNQLNAEFLIANTERAYIMQTAIKLAMMIYSHYDDYDKYYISFSNERLATSWVRFTNQEVSDIINRKREMADIVTDVLRKKEALIFNPSTETINLQEIKYFRFPNYQCDSYKINHIEDASLCDRKRLKCHLYIGDVTNKETMIKIIKESIDWVKTLKNVDSPTIHQKNGNMEADAVYINVYRYDTRQNKELFPNNQNFVCFVDYNASGETTLINGGITHQIWSQLNHEKIDKMFIAWRERKYLTNHISKVGVNSPCPCGSGKKFKKCCKGKGIYD